MPWETPSQRFLLCYIQMGSRRICNAHTLMGRGLIFKNQFKRAGISLIQLKLF